MVTTQYKPGWSAVSSNEQKNNSFLVKAQVAVRAHWIAFPSIIMETKIVPFRVVFATSEDDEDHEANELLAPGPDSRGWATSTYCIYPQVRILLFVKFSKSNTYYIYILYGLIES